MKHYKVVDRCVSELLENGFTFLYNGRGENMLTSETIQSFIFFQQRMRNEHSSVIYTFEKVCEYGIWCYKIKL